MATANGRQEAAEESVSAQTYVYGGSGSDGVRFYTGREIAAMTPEHPPWIACPWVVRGGITEVDGKIKVAGKTTWVAHLCACVLDGEPFMGRRPRLDRPGPRVRPRGRHGPQPGHGP